MTRNAILTFASKKLREIAIYEYGFSAKLHKDQLEKYEALMKAADWLEGMKPNENDENNMSRMWSSFIRSSRGRRWGRAM
jgi:hypothetical protein